MSTLTRSVLASSSLIAFALVACSPSSDSYRAEVRRTSYGVAHIEAADLASLGYGEGYAQAEDHLCSVADQVILARAERPKYLGAGPDDALLQQAIGIEALGIHDQAGRDLEQMSEELRGWYQGYVDGYNRYLVETGVDAVPGWCRGAEWVLPITTQDLAAYHRLMTLVSSRFATMIASAQPPQAADITAPTASGGAALGMASTDIPRGFDPAKLADFEVTLGASNGWALGSEWSESGRGMLIANPHYPWVGSNRFWEKHLTIPGELDVYGVGLVGIPGVAIGFNRAVAWTHTVSAGTRYTLYDLELVPGQPTRYRYDGEEREMTSQTVSVEVQQDDSSISNVERVVWSSHHGPVVDFPGVGWTTERALAIRDTNQDNDEGRQQWMEMNRANSLAEFQQAHAANQGMPWVNTIAASSDGTAWYADTSSTPNLSTDAISAWTELQSSDPFLGAMANRGVVVFPGNDPLFEWMDDPEARDPGLVSFANMPQLERRDYVFNANDSFWLANSSALLEGDYSPFHGFQDTPRSLRTRNNDLTLSHRSPDQPAGDNRKFSLEELQAAILSNRSYAAESLKSELIERCRARPRVNIESGPVALKPACDILANWDNRFDIDSRGAVLFREWITRYEPSDLTGQGKLFAVAFDPDDPVNTPRGLAPAKRSGDLALENLGQAVELLKSRGLALDVTLGELQYPPSKTAQRIPIHGGHGAWEGLLNMQQASTNTTTLEPLDLPAPVEGSRFLTEGGYPVVHGSSFLMSLEYTDEGPRAEAFLTYSQSGDPDSEHFVDQTELFSKKQWRPILFTEDQIAAHTDREYELEGPRPASD